MRLLDLLGLALSALWQQRVRMVLTTLGVLCAGFVLTFSLAGCQGVQDTITRQAQRFGELRRIDVHPKPPEGTTQPPAHMLKLSGTMSAARRQRLRQEITRRWQMHNASTAPVRLTRVQLAKIAGLDHVRSIKPAFFQDARVYLDGKAERAVIVAALPDDDQLPPQLVAGQFLPDAGSRAVVVSEFLLYQLGVTDEADVARALGRKLRLEYRANAGSPGYFLSLLGGNYPRHITLEQEKTLEKLLEKMRQKLPEALARMDLNATEKYALEALLKPVASQKEVVVTEELTICGVIRPVEDQTSFRRHGWMYREADVVVSARVAEQMHFRIPQNREFGLGSIVVEVDDMDHVKEVNEQIRGMGLGSFALVEFIEREKALYLLIFLSMGAIALAVLVVASLGIVNTMLMSVLERVREIGIMKAVGARDLHIQMIFLVEGALVGLIGGLLGLLLFWISSLLTDAWVRSMIEQKLNVKLEESIFAFPWWLVVGVPLFTCVVTTLAALLPSYRAARINPILALRHE
jgi:putative ABC transport system permease protein